MGYFINRKVDVSQPLGEEENWTLDEDMIFISTRYHIGITAPKGFDTDFASIPWFFRRIFPKSGEWNAAAIIHDYLYRCTDLPRDICDTIFREALVSLNISAWVVSAFFASVRIGGGFARKGSSAQLRCRGGQVIPLYGGGIPPVLQGE